MTTRVSPETWASLRMYYVCQSAAMWQLHIRSTGVCSQQCVHLASIALTGILVSLQGLATCTNMLLTFVIGQSFLSMLCTMQVVSSFRDPTCHLLHLFCNLHLLNASIMQIFVTRKLLQPTDPFTVLA